MSKITPMQAVALGLKTNTIKTTAAKPAAVKVASVKPIMTKQALKTTAVKTAIAKAALKTTLTKPAKAKPTVKTAIKPAAKPKADHGKKNIHKNDHKQDDKKTKPEKVKMERDSFTMPKDEYAQLTLLKARLTSMGQPAKKSELLRAGIKLLAAMSDNTLKTTLAKIPVIKTGRPNKKTN